MVADIEHHPFSKCLDPPLYFTFIVSECITITSSKEGLQVYECSFFQRKVLLLVINLFNHDSSKSTLFMLNMAFGILLSAAFVKYSKLEYVKIIQ